MNLNFFKNNLRYLKMFFKVLIALFVIIDKSLYFIFSLVVNVIRGTIKYIFPRIKAKILSLPTAPQFFFLCKVKILDLLHKSTAAIYILPNYMLVFWSFYLYVAVYVLTAFTNYVFPVKMITRSYASYFYDHEVSIVAFNSFLLYTFDQICNFTENMNELFINNIHLLRKNLLLEHFGFFDVKLSGINLGSSFSTSTLYTKTGSFYNTFLREKYNFQGFYLHTSSAEEFMPTVIKKHILSELALSEYFFNFGKILIFIFILFAVAFIIMNMLLGLEFSRIVLSSNSQRASERSKRSAYECGFEPFEDARNSFDVNFYLVALLFILFDLEIVFLLPWAVFSYYCNFFEYQMLFIFLYLLTLGFIYEWKKGALEWY